jgi:hypothetical protein
VKNEFSMTYHTLQSGMHLTGPPQVACSFQILHFQGNSDKPLMLAMHISQFRSPGVQIDQISQICGPIKLPSFNLPSLSYRNFSLKYSKPSSHFFISSMKFFINPNLMCSGNKKSYVCQLAVDF